MKKDEVIRKVSRFYFREMGGVYDPVCTYLVHTERDRDTEVREWRMLCQNYVCEASLHFR